MWHFSYVTMHVKWLFLSCGFVKHWENSFNTGITPSYSSVLHSVSGDSHVRLHGQQWGWAQFLQGAADQCAEQRWCWLVARRNQWCDRSLPLKLCEDDHRFWSKSAMWATSIFYSFYYFISKVHCCSSLCLEFQASAELISTSSTLSLNTLL